MDWFDEAVWPVLANRVKAFESLKVKVLTENSKDKQLE